MLAREDLLVLNGYAEYDQISLRDGDQVKVAFTPSFNEIKEVSLGLENKGSKEGRCEISLWNADTLLYQEILPVKEFEGNLQGKEVEWTLEKGKTYLLDLKMEDITKAVNLYVTSNGEMPLAEYGDLRLNRQTIAGQMLTGIVYSAMPNSKYMKLFIVATWMGILLAIELVLLQLKKETS